jgi:hypothetical protein
MCVTTCLQPSVPCSQVSVVCFSDEYYRGVWTFAWLAISVYCFGLLVVYFVLLFFARKAIFKRRPTELSKAIDFLHRECMCCSS